MGDEKYIEKWEKIAALSPYNQQTVRKKFGREMMEAGYVFRSVVGPAGRRRVVIWSYENLVKAFFSKKQSLNLKV